MIKAIIYNSNTGHTFRYADMLSKKLDVSCYSLKEANKFLNKNDEVIYLSWICAGMITKVNKVKNKYNVKGYGAVGAYPEDPKYIKTAEKANNLNAPLFYLRGGIDYNKLKGIKRKIVQMVGKVLEKENPDNQELINVFKNGADFVNEKNLDEIVSYIRKEL